MQDFGHQPYQQPDPNAHQNVRAVPPRCPLGGSWVVTSGVISHYKSPNMGSMYSYPTYNPTYNCSKP